MTDVTPPPAAPSEPPAVPVATPTQVEVVAPKKKSGALGGFALVLAILAILGDIVVIVFGIVTLATAVNGFDMSNLEFGPILAAFGAFAAVAVFAFFGGLILGVLALLFGLIAAIKGRGRVAGVFAVILSVLVLISHGSVALAIAQTGDSISNLTSVLPS